MGLTIPTGAIFKSKQEFVYQVLRSSIMKCQLPPGEKLIIQDIADQLSVSAIPVREALRLLASEDLVEYNAHTGASVSRISAESITETFTLKEALESAAVRVASMKITEVELAELKALNAKMEQHIKNEEFAEWAEVNGQFHMAITNITDMPMLKEMQNRVLDKWERIRTFFFSEILINRHAESNLDHVKLIHAMEEGNVDMAEQLSKKHNRDALEFYMNYINLQHT
jgi:DNA-binding GntR family transcriptional regulator